MSDTAAEVIIQVLVPQSMFAALGEFAADAQLKANAAIQDVFDTLALPARVSVSLRVRLDGWGPGACLIDVRIGAEQCRYAADLLWRLRCFLLAKPVEPDTTFAQPEGVRVDALIKSFSPPALAHFIAEASREIVKADPVHCCTRAVTGGWLDMTAVRARVSRRMAAGENGGDAIRVEMSEATLNWLTREFVGVAPERFEGLRKDMSNRYGFAVPPFRFVIAKDLPDYAFVFRVGCLRTVPVQGLQPCQRVIPRSPKMLESVRWSQRAVWQDGQPTRVQSPSSREIYTLVPGWDAENAQEAASYSVFDPLHYLCWWLERAITDHLGAVLTDGEVEAMMGRVAYSHPRLSEVAESRLGTDTLAEILRGLVIEHVPLTNLPRILEVLVSSGAPDAKQTSTADVVQFVRRGLRNQLRGVFGRGRTNQTVIVYLLDGAIDMHLEIIASNGREQTVQDSRNAILDALDKEIQHLPESVAVPGLITTLKLRQSLASVVNPVYPRIPVFAFEELPPDVNLQPIARIMG